MIQFEKPNYKITDYVEKNNYGRFVLEPLERGFGATIGNALRRVMLSSLPGSAITSVKIDGVLHEFQTIEGVVEDVTTIILNLKNVVIKKHCEGDKTIRLNATTEGVVKAGDFECDPHDGCGDPGAAAPAPAGAGHHLHPGHHLPGHQADAPHQGAGGPGGV